MAAERRSGPRAGALALAVLVAAAAIFYVLRGAGGRGGDEASAPEQAEPAPPAAAELEPAEVARAAPDPVQAAPGRTPDERVHEGPPELLAAPLDGRIVVTVSELTGLPVEAALVQLVRAGHRDELAELDVDADGRCVFEGVASGRYWARVAPYSLQPDGYLPPAMQERENPYAADPSWSRENPGYYHDVVALDEERREASLELYVAAPAFARGHVYDAAGKGVEDVLIQFSTLAVGAFAPGALTDEEGAYEIEGLRRARYLPMLGFGPSRSFPPGPGGRPVSESSVPPPEILELFPGDRIVLDFRLGRGDGLVVGRAVDQHGEPVADLDVLAFYDGWGSGSTAATVRTEPDGSFALRNLHRARLRVQVGGVWGAHPGPDRTGRKRLAEYPEQQTVDLTAESRVDLGTVSVWRLEYVTIEGQVTASEEARRIHLIEPGFEGDEVSLTIDDGSKYTFPGGASELTEDGSYSIPIETRSSGERYATLTLRAGMYVAVSEPVWIPREATTIRHDFVIR